MLFLHFQKKKSIVFPHRLPGQAVSIPSNVAEGSSRTSMKDYNRFLEISLGSSFELETQLLIAEAVNFGDKEKRDDLLKDIDEEQKMLMSFISKLKL